MTFEHTYDNWQHLPPPARHRVCSPNLRLVLTEVQDRWPGFTNLGCYGVRSIRGGESPSSHSYGAAIDIGYPPDMDAVVELQVCPFLIGRSGELHVQAVHDYRRCRIWHAGRTPDDAEACSTWWRAQRASPQSGMGQVWANHLHLEVTAAGWADDAPMSARWTD